MELSDLLKQLQQLFDEGKYTQLKEEADDYLLENDGSVELFLLLAKACAANGEIADTEYYCLNAKELAPNDTTPLFLLVTLKMQVKDSLGAQHYLEKILELDPKNAKADALIADIFYADDMYDGAIEHYKKSLENGAKEQLSAEEYALIVYKMAAAYFSDKNYSAALTTIDNFAPNEFDEHLTLLKRNIYVGMGPGKMEDVVACVELLHANVPDHPAYILELVQYVDDAGDTDRKIDLLNKCLALPLSDQQKVLTLRSRGEAFAEQNKWQEALNDFTALLAIQEDWYDYQRIAEIKEALQDVKGAIQDISKAMKLVGDPYAPLVAFRARLLFKAGVVDKAIADFTALLSIPGADDADTYYNLGIAYNKLGEKSNAVKMLIRAEMLGHEKAGELLMKSFSEHLIAARQKVSAKFLAEFSPDFDRNKRSPILAKAFGQLWIPNMYKFLLSNEAEIGNFPSSVIRQMLSEAEKDMLLITPEGLLLFEGEEEPVEAYYRVEIESEHSILLELQPTKGSDKSNMRLSFFEGNLLMSYPLGEAEVPAKYFVQAQEVNDDQKSRLSTKKVNVPYMDAIENTIATILGS